MKPFSREDARYRVEMVTNEIVSWEGALADRKRLFREAETEEEKRIGIGYIAIAQSHINHLCKVRDHYARISRGEV